ncbi:hypothetical protein FSPOR_10844 [Fusarium sporotrichioides]|uniref:Uncharacterized protein n=1 Tax=Fusarium sporotrichioides TaxID=5514 RepID=A0A395RJ35_FUSSP|nr:hypothetical protein FSPOR_10844 [Fusarium sporotrichioides]
MSGLEILGAVASSIALGQAVKGTLKAVDFLRQNSGMKRECGDLKGEILMIEYLIIQAQQQADPAMPAQRLLGLTEYPLVSLATEQLQDILNELNQILEKYSHHRKANDPKRYVDRVKWLSDASKIDDLRERSQAIKSNLHMAITFRVSSMVDHGNIRQEVSVEARKARGQEAEDRGVIHSPNLAREETGGQNMSLDAVFRNENFMNLTTIQSQSTRMCGPGCQCRCHRNKQEYTGGSWAKSLLGSWLVRYEFSGNTCQGSCRSNTAVKLEYQLPKWLWAGVVSVEMCQDPRLNLSLRPCRVLPLSHEVYFMIDHPLVLQEHIRNGHKYFPDDTNKIGQTLLETQLQIIGCDLVRICDESEPKPDIFRFILESVTSYIPDWDESHRSDVHLEAMDPGGTQEGMLKALQEQPWAIDELDGTGFSPIHHAIVEGNLEALDLLIKAKANINQHCYAKRTPLVLSAQAGRERETARLLESEECRMNMNYTAPSRFSALDFAIKIGSLAIVRMLLEAGATVKRHNSFEPLLQTFSRYTKGSQDAADEMFHTLLMHGADLEEKDNFGYTAVMRAVLCKNALALRSLVSAGASLTGISSENANVLHFVAAYPDVDMINCIRKQNPAGVGLEQRDIYDRNPLHILYEVWNLPSWKITDFPPRPSFVEMETFIKFYFDLLIPDLRRHMLTIDSLLRAVKYRDVSTATEILDQLIERKVRCNQTGLVGWHRGLKGYVVDGGWDYLEDVLKDEYDETNDKIGRASVARCKAINDPEMEEFF